MPSTLRDICFDCASGRFVGEFWRGVLGGELQVQDSGDACLEPGDASGIRYWFNQVPEPKSVKNRVHIDVNMPDDAEMDRILRLGATVVGEVREDAGRCGGRSLPTSRTMSSAPSHLRAETMVP